MSSLKTKDRYLKFTEKTLNLDYLKLQKQYADLYGSEKTIVLMQVGSFHEAYSTKTEGYDLHKLSNILNITVTKKNKKIKDVSMKNPYMIGFPIVATSKFVRILVENGFHIIQIDQVTPPPKPKRAITGIYSPGTYIEETLSNDSNNIISLYFEEVKQMSSKSILLVGLSIIDLTIGKSIVHEIYSTLEDDKYSLDECIKFISNFNPSDIIINYKNLSTIKIDNLINYLELSNKNCMIYKFDNKEMCNINYQNSYFEKIFKIKSYLSIIENLNLEKLEYARLSFIILLNYCETHNENLITNLSVPEFYNNSKYLHLGNNAFRQLEIFVNKGNDINKFNSLQNVINFTSTPMGQRFLKYNLGNPIFDKKILNERYLIIDNIIENDLENEYKQTLQNIIDIERIHRKISLGNLHPFDFSNLNDSYNFIINLYKVCQKSKLKEIFTKDIYNDLTKFMKFYNSIFNVDEMTKYNLNEIDGSFYKKNIHIEIDSLQNDNSNNKNFLKNIRDKLEKYIDDKKKDHFNDNSEDDNDDENRQSMIKIQYNTINKYHFLITTRRSQQLKSNFNNKSFKVDSYTINFKDFIFKSQSKSDSTKIQSDLLDQISDKIINNTEKLKSKMRETYINDLIKIYDNYSCLFNKLSHVISYIDFLVSGAICANKYNYNKPIIKENGDKSFIKAKGIRHPIIERIITSSYVKHDINLGTKDINGILLYGLNSAGKSSLMKSIGLNVILAQIGYFVSCNEFIFYPYNSIFTRIESTDNIFKGLSSFALELVELKAILKRSGSNTLVIADEVCKGTENSSALIIVMTMIKMLTNSNTSFISATHLHELVKYDFINQINNLKVQHLEVLYKNNDIIFNRLLKDGNGKEEYGLDFAKYIIPDNNFIEISTQVKNIVKNNKNFFDNEISKYNKNIILEKCDICDCRDNLETHHIEFQKDCDKHGFILKSNKSHIHKNHSSNLVILCNKCHDKIHNNLIIIEGYEETITGNTLKYSFVNSSDKNKNLKFDKEIIDFTLKNKNSPNITRQKMKILIEKKYSNKISTSTIGKIWNGSYI